MAGVISESRAVRRQLERALASAKFARSERLSRFLRFVVERHLEGRDEELKESVIAIEVFGTRDYDPKQDSLVRTEAGRLRARLAEYYLGEGDGDPVIIELPKGGYVPVFRHVNETRGAQGKRRPWLIVALGCFVVALTTTGWWQFHRQTAPIPIAVLPLDNLSRDPANDYFSDGLTDEIIRNLSMLEGLAVRSQTSSFVFKGRPRNIREAGQQLQADYILEGSVLRVGQQLRINAQLVRVRDDFPLWSGRFDKEVTDIFAIQDGISLAIVNSLRLKLGRGRRRYETSAEAYDLYLRARSLSIQRGLPGVNESIGPFEAVIAKDPSFAPAYAGLAAAHAVRSGEFPFDTADELEKMRTASKKAIQLDPLLAEAHDALALVYSRDGNWQESERSFRRALELDPGRSESHRHFVSYFLVPLGRTGEAVKEARLSKNADPLSPEANSVMAYAMIAVGRYDEAAGYCEQIPQGFPSKSVCLGRARIWQGKIDQAIQILATALDQGVPPGSPVRGHLGYAYGRAGRREEAEEIATAASAYAPQQALTFAGLGDKDRTLEALDRMTVLGAVRIGRALTWPEFALLRGDPRVKALRKKVGLPE
jgi:TolB-like protein/Flp pilus assembly protein TadD